MTRCSSIRWPNTRKKRGYKLDTEMTAGDWKALVEIFKEKYKKAIGEDFPQDVYKQLELATKAVFESLDGQARH